MMSDNRNRSTFRGAYPASFEKISEANLLRPLYVAVLVSPICLVGKYKFASSSSGNIPVKDLLTVSLFLLTSFLFSDK
jgi:hypothetical protein